MYILQILKNHLCICIYIFTCARFLACNYFFYSLTYIMTSIALYNKYVHLHLFEAKLLSRVSNCLSSYEFSSINFSQLTNENSGVF